MDPQITLGLLTEATGFPLNVAGFEGNMAETATMVPVINAFKAAHHLTDVTVVADAGMISEANQVALQAAGLSYILCVSSSDLAPGSAQPPCRLVRYRGQLIHGLMMRCRVGMTSLLRVRPIGWESDAHSMRSSYFIDEGIDVSLVTYLKPGAAA